MSASFIYLSGIRPARLDDKACDAISYCEKLSDGPRLPLVILEVGL